jgi:hypothetical protein
MQVLYNRHQQHIQCHRMSYQQPRPVRQCSRPCPQHSRRAMRRRECSSARLNVACQMMFGLAFVSMNCGVCLEQNNTHALSQECSHRPQTTVSSFELHAATSVQHCTSLNELTSIPLVHFRFSTKLCDIRQDLLAREHGSRTQQHNIQPSFSVYHMLQLNHHI